MIGRCPGGLKCDSGWFQTISLGFATVDLMLCSSASRLGSRSSRSLRTIPDQVGCASHLQSRSRYCLVFRSQASRSHASFHVCKEEKGCGLSLAFTITRQKAAIALSIGHLYIATMQSRAAITQSNPWAVYKCRILGFLLVLSYFEPYTSSGAILQEYFHQGERVSDF